MLITLLKFLLKKNFKNRPIRLLKIWKRVCRISFMIHGAVCRIVTEQIANNSNGDTGKFNVKHVKYPKSKSEFEIADR